MLVLSRQAGESVRIGENIEITVLDVRAGVVKIGIEAPSDVSIHRQEIYDEIQRSNQEAATPDQPVVPKILRKNNQNTENRNLVAIK